MAGEYRPRHPERTVLCRVLFHHLERFLAEYESRFEREYGYFRPIVKEVVERYLYGDQKFVTPAWGKTGNYHLKSGSPAINRGTATGAPKDDLDQKKRDSKPDIGAYEFGATGRK